MAVGLGGAWLGGDAEERRGKESTGSRTRDDDARDDVDGMGWEGRGSKQVRHSAKLEYRQTQR